MMRTDINLAIIAMVEEPTLSTTNTTQEYCFVVDDSNTTAPSVYHTKINSLPSKKSF